MSKLPWDRKSETAHHFIAAITWIEPYCYPRNWMAFVHTVPLRVMYFVNTVFPMLVDRRVVREETESILVCHAI